MNLLTSYTTCMSIKNLRDNLVGIHYQVIIEINRKC